MFSWNIYSTEKEIGELDHWAIWGNESDLCYLKPVQKEGTFVTVGLAPESLGVPHLGDQVPAFAGSVHFCCT